MISVNIDTEHFQYVVRYTMFLRKKGIQSENIA